MAIQLRGDPEVLLFEESEHRYFMTARGDDEETGTFRVETEELPSVTRCIKTAGMMHLWPGMTEAAWRGQYVHHCCYLLDEDDLVRNSVDPRYDGYVQAYERFKVETGFRVELNEVRVWHEKYRYAGALDRTGILAGRRVLIDLKTGPPADWWGLQTAAYSECLPERPERRYCLQLSKNGTYKLHRHEERSDIQFFLAALAVTRWKMRHKP